jgi:transposase-like protein
LSAAAYAQQHQLSRSAIFRWSSQLRSTVAAAAPASTPTVSFLPVRVRGVAPVEAPVFSLEVTLRNGRTVRAHGDVDASRLARVVDALEGGAA